MVNYQITNYNLPITNPCYQHSILSYNHKKWAAANYQKLSICRQKVYDCLRHGLGADHGTQRIDL
jgi:hypothetical protein